MNPQSFAARLSNLPSARRQRFTTILHTAALPTASHWLDYDDSIGEYIGRFNLRHIWEATGSAVNVFSNIGSNIKLFLDGAVEPMSRMVTWSFYMAGRVRRPSFSSPYIIFCCEVEDLRRGIRNMIIESGILSNYPGLKTDDMPKPPGLPRLVTLADGETETFRHSHGDIMMLTSSFKSACGSRIFVDTDGNGSGAFSATATIGGVVRIGENTYHTTAAHFLSPTPGSAVTNPILSADNDHKTHGKSSETLHNATSYHHGGDNIANVNPSYSNTPGSLFDHLESGRHWRAEEPDQISLERRHEADNSVSYRTDLEELSLKSIGKPFINSMELGDYAAGLDYVLIETRTSSRDHILENVVRMGHDYEHFIKVHSVIRSWPQNLEVFAVTHRGIIKGHMSGAPFYSSAPGRRFFIEMFKVSLDGPLYTGDCGAWIIETTKGDLIGHIVLGSPGDGNALVVPFSDIFDDISSRVGKSPTFPVAQDDGGEERTTPILNEEVVRAEGLLDVPSFENNLEESNITKHTSLDAEDVESLAVSPRDKTAITAPLTRALPEASSQLVKARNDWIGDISKEFEQLMAQKRPRPLRQRNKIQETSHASAKSNVGLGVDPARVSRSASPPRPLNFIPRHIKWPNSLAPALTDPTFRDMLFSFCNVPMEWEVPNLLDRALGQIDLNAIYGAAEEESESLITHAQSMGDNIKADWGYKDCVIRALLRYFHGSFFISIDDSAREFCQSNVPATFRGNILPNEEEKVGGLQAVELYQCPEPHCLATMRLPRYWNVWTVLRTRRGRSGEAANCFGMLCRALGSRVRWVWCAEDRVWTEVYSEHWKRWVHVDAYEGAWDDPLLYAGALGKKMSYCIAFSTDGAVDVTRRYVRRSSHALPRGRCSEEQLLRTINSIKKMRRIDMSDEELLRLRREDSAEVKELESYNASSRVMGPEDHRSTSTEGNLVQRKSAGRMPGSRTLRTDSRESLTGY